MREGHADSSLQAVLDFLHRPRVSQWRSAHLPRLRLQQCPSTHAVTKKAKGVSPGDSRQSGDKQRVRPSAKPGGHAAACTAAAQLPPPPLMLLPPPPRTAPGRLQVTEEATLMTIPAASVAGRRKSFPQVRSAANEGASLERTSTSEAHASDSEPQHSDRQVSQRVVFAAPSCRTAGGLRAARVAAASNTLLHTLNQFVHSSDAAKDANDRPDSPDVTPESILLVRNSFKTAHRAPRAGGGPASEAPASAASARPGMPPALRSPGSPLEPKSRSEKVERSSRQPTGPKLRSLSATVANRHSAWRSGAAVAANTAAASTANVASARRSRAAPMSARARLYRGAEEQRVLTEHIRRHALSDKVCLAPCTARTPSLPRHRRPQTSSAPIVTLCMHQEARDGVDPIAISKAQQQRRAHSASGPSYRKPSSARAHQRAALLVSPSQCQGSQYRPAFPQAADHDLAILGSAAPPPSHQAAPHATGEAIDWASQDGVIGARATSASTSAKRPRPESKKALYLRSLLEFLGASSSDVSTDAVRRSPQPLQPVQHRSTVDDSGCYTGAHSVSPWNTDS